MRIMMAPYVERLQVYYFSFSISLGRLTVVTVKTT
jgi:hypothetical protein